jgi:hypothetical protein
MILQPQDYNVEFTLLMPGAQKVTTYTVVVKGASCRSEAIARAEEDWQKITSQYDVKVKAIDAKKAGDS